VDRSLSSPLFLAVRVRRVLARTVTRRAIVVLAAVVTAVAVTTVLRSAEHTRSRWGETRRVAMAQHDLVPGDVVDAGAVSLHEVPRAAVAGAATDVVPLGAVVRYPIAAGEPVVGTRLAPEGLTGVAALVPEGQRAVAIAVGPTGVPPVHPGDRVDVVALTPAPSATEEAPVTDGETEAPPDPATTLVDQALVVDASEATVTVAVPLALASAVAYAAAQGLVALTLVGG
jgi:Flp pilus assembly protein CpaB